MGFWSSVGSAISSGLSAVCSAVSSIGSAAVGFASECLPKVGTILTTLGGSLGMVANVVVAVCQILSILRQDESAEDLGDRALQWDRITDTHHLYKMKTPEVLIDQSIETINLEENFNIRLVAIERLIEGKNLLGMTQKRYEVINHITNDILIHPNDLLLVFGKTEDLRKLASL